MRYTKGKSEGRATTEAKGAAGDGASMGRSRELAEGQEKVGLVSVWVRVLRSSTEKNRKRIVRVSVVMISIVCVQIGFVQTAALRCQARERKVRSITISFLLLTSEFDLVVPMQMGAIV